MNIFNNILTSIGKPGRLAAVLLAGAATSFAAMAHDLPEFHITDMSVGRNDGRIRVAMNINPKEYHLSYNKQIVVTPVLRSTTSTDSLALEPFSVAGRNAYYNAERSEQTSGPLFRAGHGDTYAYASEADWADWMEHSRLVFNSRTIGCCNTPDGPAGSTPVAELNYAPPVYKPTYSYSVPTDTRVKEFNIDGRAYVSFPVNSMEIIPDYLINPQELRKITSSVDSVRDNSDATVKSISLTGYASPEGPYANNVRLAAGRTKAVRDYVMGQYTFPASVFHTNSVAEDWAGLRDSVAASVLPDRAEILEFIDHGNVPVERRNDELRRRFPHSYAYLLKTVYPWLRHTDYRIHYTVRKYDDVNEILRVMKQRPENLSVYEFYKAAETFPKNSPEYDKVWELAAIHHPEDATANLNAANSAMHNGDYKRARMLLERVPASPLTTYNIGVLDALEGNYADARTHLEAAQKAGVAEADAALEELRRIMADSEPVRYLPAR